MKALRKALSRALSRAREGELALNVKASLEKMRQRREATTLGEEHRYVNVAGGARGSAQLWILTNVRGDVVDWTDPTRDRGAARRGASDGRRRRR